MKRSIGILLGLALVAGAGLAQARGGGGGGHGGGGHSGGGMGGRPGMSGGQHFTTGPMHFTSGTSGGFTRFTTGPHPGVRPGVGVRPGPVIVGRPFPHHHVVAGTTVVVGAPFFWYPPYPYPYVAPVYGGSAYNETPTYIEQSDLRYYCPDYQDYYPNVQSCPSPWMQVIPDMSASQPQQQ